MLNDRYIYAGVGLLYALLVVGLIAGKLAGHLHHGWWVILSPLWVPVVLTVVAVIIAIALFANEKGNPFQ